MKLTTGETHSGSRTQIKILTYGSMNNTNLNLKSKNIKENYGKNENEMKAHVFDVLPE